jgi:hypothetical protein
LRRPTGSPAERPGPPPRARARRTTASSSTPAAFRPGRAPRTAAPRAVTARTPQVEDLYLASEEKRMVRIKKGTEYRCSMLRDQHFSSLFRHYGKHNGVDKDGLVFFFTEELMQELDGNDTPRSVHLRKNDVIVIRHRYKEEPKGLFVRLDLDERDALAVIGAYPSARSLKSADGRTALHHVAKRAGYDEPEKVRADLARKATKLAVDLLLLGCDPSATNHYGQTAMMIAMEHAKMDAPDDPHRELVGVLRPHEFKRQMAVIRAHFVGRKAGEGRTKSAEDIILKRACTSKNVDVQGEAKHNAAVRFLFSALAHGNQARNFKRVVCFLYA